MLERDAAAAVAERVVDAAVPYVEPSARLVGRAANDVLDKGTLSEGTRAALAESGRGAEQAAARGVGSLLRGAAKVLDGGGDVAAPAPRSGAANVADAFGSSLGRALAPYAAGLAVLAVALAALREATDQSRRVLAVLFDLAPLVGADLDVMDRDSKKMRGEKPFIFSNIKAGVGVADVAALIEQTGGL